MNKTVTECLYSYKDQMIKDLSDFIAIDSVSDNHEKVAEALEFALELGKNMGFRSESCADGQVGVIEMGSGHETLGILAHVDVVSPGDMDQWETDPFKAVIKDDRVYGRGTLDDKGMIIATLYAMKAVTDLGLPIRKRVQLILGTQEEVDWVDMNAYVKAYPLPDYGFSPDGEYPICNIEKGVSDVLLEFDTEDAVAGLTVKEIQCGEAANIVPGKAVAKLSDGSEVVAKGKAVHSCQPEKGNNALFILCDMLKEKGVADNRLFTVLKAIDDNFRDMIGKKIGLESESEYYQGEFVHRNVFSPTIFKTADGKTKVNIDIRFAYGTSSDEIREHLAGFAKSYGGTLVKETALPAVFVSKEKPFLSVCAKAYEDVTGLKNEFTLAYGGSYAKAMPDIVSWGPIFLGEEDTCHEPNEYIAIDSLMKNADIFAQTIEGIALSGQSFK